MVTSLLAIPPKNSTLKPDSSMASIEFSCTSTTSCSPHHLSVEYIVPHGGAVHRTTIERKKRWVTYYFCTSYVSSANSSFRPTSIRLLLQIVKSKYKKTTKIGHWAKKYTDQSEITTIVRSCKAWNDCVSVFLFVCMLMPKSFIFGHLCWLTSRWLPPAKEEGYVFTLSVCMFVCPLYYSKSCKRILMKCLEARDVAQGTID